MRAFCSTVAPDCEHVNNYVFCGLADTPDQVPDSVSGKIALIQRGSTATAQGQGTGLFSNKAAIAAAKGAIAAVIYNNVDGELSAATARKATIHPTSWPATRPRSPPSANCSRPSPPRHRCGCRSRSPARRPARSAPSSPHERRVVRPPPVGAAPGDTLVDTLRDADVSPDTRVWVAGEAAAMQRIRRHIFEERRLPRARASIRGYWKHGRSGGSDDDG